MTAGGERGWYAKKGGFETCPYTPCAINHYFYCFLAVFFQPEEVHARRQLAQRDGFRGAGYLLGVHHRARRRNHRERAARRPASRTSDANELG
jgi:hypothetical protein